MNFAARPEPQYITIGYLRCLLEYLRGRGFPLAPVLACLKLSEADLSDLDRRIPDEAEDAVLLAARELTGDPDIGLHAGQTMRPTHLGLLGHLLMISRESREWFELHRRYEKLVGNGSVAEYDVVDGEVRMTLYRRGGAAPYTRQVIEYSLSGWISLARWLAGPEFSPSRIEFPHEAPARLELQREFFRCPLHFGCSELRMYFSPRTLALPLRHGDVSLRDALEAEATRRLQALQVEQIDADPQIAAIRQFVAARLAYGVPEIGATAEAVRMSVRTLQRRLDDRGTNYSELVDQVRRSLAERHARDRSLSLAELALMLGFSEQSTFQRAFRRWFDMTPGEYRRR